MLQPQSVLATLSHDHHTDSGYAYRDCREDLKSLVSPRSMKSSGSRQKSTKGPVEKVSSDAKNSDLLESIIRNRDAIPVGYFVEAVKLGDQKSRWIAECSNREDDWVPSSGVSLISDKEELHRKLSDLVDGEKHRDAEDTSVQLNTSFFQLSSFSKSNQSSRHHHRPARSDGSQDTSHLGPKTIRGIFFSGSGASQTGMQQAWYKSPYPSSYCSVSDYLHVCDCCLSYFRTVKELTAHLSPDVPNGCGSGSGKPPGVHMYLKGSLMVTEVDGDLNWEYCERLILLSKLFLEDKRMAPPPLDGTPDVGQREQVKPFLFYVLTRKVGRDRWPFVGYFSKYKSEKKDLPILSCILVMPHEQKKGFGQFLISLSYELAKREGAKGSAERPLSDPGQAAYMTWWSTRLCEVLRKCFDGESLRISQLSELSGMTSEDVVECLRETGALKLWGASSGDVKLRESGKAAKIKVSMPLLQALERRAVKPPTIGGRKVAEFDPKGICNWNPRQATPVPISIEPPPPPSSTTAE